MSNPDFRTIKLADGRSETYRRGTVGYELLGMVDRPSTAEFSKMLFQARESAEMLADMVEARTGRPDRMNRELVAQIDAYRAARGWKPFGFGGEGDAPEPHDSGRAES